MSGNKLDADQLEKLSNIFKVLFNRPDLELNDNLTAKDVPGWDSFNHVNLIINIEEEFDDEQDTLWEQVWDYDWYEPSDKEKRARENYEKAKQEYKKSTGRDWHDNDWKKNWDDAWNDAFKDFLGDAVDLDECYEILGLPNDAEFSEVKKRYRELALKHHPDRCKDKKEAERKFKEIAAAYEKIKESVEVNTTSKA